MNKAIREYLKQFNDKALAVSYKMPDGRVVIFQKDQSGKWRMLKEPGKSAN